MYYKDREYKEPCTTANLISEKSYCQLGGVENPALCKKDNWNGTYHYFTYYLRSY